MSIVIKYGGNAMTEPATRRAVAGGLRNLAGKGGGASARAVPPVVVHGGGPYIQAALDEAGLEHRFERGLRVTSPESVVVIERVLTMLAKELAFEIGPAVGITARDARCITAEVRDPALGRVGRVTHVDTRVLRALRGGGLVPVLACLALDAEGNALNVNGDEAAGAVAGALGEGVVFLTNVPGVLDDPAVPGSLLSTLTRAEARARIEDGRIAGGMIPKVEAALDALAMGAPFAVVADGRDPDGVERALAGGGTRVLAD
ncbi:MAG: acetylglutamate kinase [Trueperaceae bacterium]|nr:acetylglutamate kinase [Trueperaceae bacterium]MCO5174856.1 acetylglutamate kinase [Trueperaceae bacterium]MCW5818592.1 acetylglutamate kinase [Trueperaceae bacterium]